MKAIYKYNENFGRMGYLSGVFIEDSDKTKEMLGSNVYFGEILGKHSEIVGTMSNKTLTFVTADPTIIQLFEEFELSNGTNPFDYLDSEELENFREDKDFD